MMAAWYFELFMRSLAAIGALGLGLHAVLRAIGSAQQRNIEDAALSGMLGGALLALAFGVLCWR